MQKTKVARHQADQRNLAILVVDDHPIILEGLSRLFGPEHGIELLYASSFAQALRTYRSSKPGIIVVDLAMRPGAMSGLSFIRRLRRHDPDVALLVFSMHDDPRTVREALRLGANGYLAKDASTEALSQAITAVRRGTPYVDPALASELAFLNARPMATEGMDSLSQRELQVLSLLADGKSYGQIAHNLTLTYKAVAHICARLKPKLGVTSLQELVQFAVRNMPSKAPPVLGPAKRSNQLGKT